MAKVKIQGNASGTGVLTVTAPNTSTDRTITLPDGTGTLIADDGSGNLGINTTTPSSLLEVKAGSNSTTDYPITVLNSAESVTTGYGAYGIDQSASSAYTIDVHDDLVIKSNTGENLRVLENGGITFNGDTAAANALDDYEEGTFTVTLSCAGNTDDKTCRYTKVGNIVTVNFSSTGSVNSYWQIYGSTDDAVTITSALPFTPLDNGGVVCPVVRSIRVSSAYTEDHNLVMGIGWRKNSTTLYLGSGRTNDYYHTNNAVKTNTQTNITISGTATFMVS